MNGLVGYGSSDSEDEIETVQKSRVESSKTDTKQPELGDPSSARDRANGFNNDNDLIIGPSLEQQSPSREQISSTTFDGPDLTGLSAADQLRVLTQPEHPASLDFPEPTVVAQQSTTAQFKRFLALKAQGRNFNADLAGRTWFKNPNVLVELMDQRGLKQQDMYAVTAISGEKYGVAVLPDWAQNGRLHETWGTMDRDSKAQEEQDRKNGSGRIEFVKARADE